MEPETMHNDTKGTSRYCPRTPFGEELWRIRERIIESEAELLDRDGLEREIASRREGVEE